MASPSSRASTTALAASARIDDLVARIDIASIPLPAGGLLLLGGLGGLGLAARRRSART